MSNLRFSYSSGRDGKKLPWFAICAVVTAAIVAGVFTYFQPDAVSAALSAVTSKLGSDKIARSTQSQDHNASMCNGLIVMNCTAHSNAAPVPAPTPAPAQVAKQLAEDVGASQRQAPPSTTVKAKSDDDFVTRKYKKIGPEDTLTYNRDRATNDLCVLKPYEPCYMPKGSGRDTLIRPRD